MTDFSPFFEVHGRPAVNQARSYLHGLVQGGASERNIERMAEIVPDLNYQSVHHFVANSRWCHNALRAEVAGQASSLLGGGSRTRAIIDETSFSKKGGGTVGVARQHNGRLGKVDNCQVAVFTALSAGFHATLVDFRLYLPKEWTDSPARCGAAGVPPEFQVFKTKPQLALDSIMDMRRMNIAFDVVCMDSGYGSQPSLLHALDSEGVTYVAEVHSDQLVWEECPWTHQEGGRPGIVLKKARPSQKGVRVDNLAAATDPMEWRRLKVRDSDRGWVEVNYTARRVWTVRDGVESLVWWLAWRNVDDPDGRLHHALSNAPADFDERVLVGDGMARGKIEETFRDAKSELGLADFQVRKWGAWHHHVAMVMLAMLFTLRERMHYSTPAGMPRLTVGEIVFVLGRMLPRRGGSVEEALEMVAERRRKRQEDQKRRREKTARTRPPLLPDEEIVS